MTHNKLAKVQLNLNNVDMSSVVKINLGTQKQIYESWQLQVLCLLFDLENLSCDIRILMSIFKPNKNLFFI